MRVLTITELRKWAKGNGFDDSWWVCINGNNLEVPVKLADVPREGDVLLLNLNSQSTEKEEWLVLRYPGYKTPEEKAEKERLKNLPTIKQSIALDFFGYKQEVSREEASKILDKCFEVPSNYGRYQDHLWNNYEKLYSGRELYEKTVDRLKNQMFYIKKNASKRTLDSLVDEATKSGIPYKSFVDLIKLRHPEILLANSTQKRKKGEYETHNKRNQEWKSEQNQSKKGGCLGMTVLLVFPILIFCVFANS